MILVKASTDSEAGKLPSQELPEEMGRYNEELADAGILLVGTESLLDQIVNSRYRRRRY